MKALRTSVLIMAMFGGVVQADSPDATRRPITTRTFARITAHSRQSKTTWRRAAEVTTIRPDKTAGFYRRIRIRLALIGIVRGVVLVE
jgi:hypothetical protein